MFSESGSLLAALDVEHPSISKVLTTSEGVTCLTRARTSRDQEKIGVLKGSFLGVRVTFFLSFLD